jgi:hypothetical protein
MDLAPIISPLPVSDWIGPPNSQASLDVAAPIEELIINAHILLTSQPQSPPSVIDCLLQFHPPGQGGAYCEDDYIPLDAVAPLYLTVRQKHKTWIVERLGKFRGSLHYPGRTKLTSGAAVHLVDNDLATHTLGFIKPHLLGIIGPSSRSELGYTIFCLAIHLYLKTAKFFPRPHQRATLPSLTISYQPHTTPVSTSLLLWVRGLFLGQVRRTLSPCCPHCIVGNSLGGRTPRRRRSRDGMRSSRRSWDPFDQ